MLTAVIEKDHWLNKQIIVKLTGHFVAYLKDLSEDMRMSEHFNSPGVAHTVRERVNRHLPLHVKFKLTLEKGSLRNKAVLKFLSRAIACARRQGLGIIHYSLQHNHVHLLLEANDNKTLTRGMRALTISLVMRLNHYWQKNTGRIKERYHLHVLKTLQEVGAILDPPKSWRFKQVTLHR